MSARTKEQIEQLVAEILIRPDESNTTLSVVKFRKPRDPQEDPMYLRWDTLLKALNAQKRLLDLARDMFQNQSIAVDAIYGLGDSHLARILTQRLGLALLTCDSTTEEIDKLVEEDSTRCLVFDKRLVGGSDCLQAIRDLNNGGLATPAVMALVNYEYPVNGQLTQAGIQVVSLTTRSAILNHELLTYHNQQDLIAKARSYHPTPVLNP